MLLGRYDVRKIIDTRTFVKVHHTRNVKTREVLAIKVINKEKILKVGLMAQVKCEHRAIVRGYDDEVKDLHDGVRERRQAIQQGGEGSVEEEETTN
ncbi:CBL-interacting protein kinase 12 [Perilla frutescens var. frutescens]|nr:CBL-interacting protein kinase 12 [Perilla frutescens var. frutescens]